MRSDVIIRDVKRLDFYPDDPKIKKGISPWFKVGLAGTYHRGILVGINWVGLVKDGQNWRLKNLKTKEESRITAALMGYIPYENIVSVDWDGDEYYGHAQIYCHFDARKGEPSEKIIYCEKKENDHTDWYTEIASYEEVENNSERKENFKHA